MGQLPKTDENILDEIAEVLKTHPELDSRKLEVEILNGHVTLKGQIESLPSKIEAEYLIGRIAGVKDVDNFIEINKDIASSVEASLSGQDNLILKSRGLIILFLFFVFSCGDNSPFDEDYWDENLPSDEQEEQSRNTGRYSVALSPVSNIGFSSGSAVLDIQGNAAFMEIKLEDLPQNIIQGQITVSSSRCEDIFTTPTVSGISETKDYSYSENGTRSGLFRETNPNDDLLGKAFVVNAFAVASATNPQSGIFPLACGVIQREDASVGSDNENGSGTAGSTTTNANGGTVTGSVTNGTVTGGGLATSGTTTGGITTGGITTGGITTGGFTNGAAGTGGLATVGGSTGGLSTTGGATAGGFTGTTTGGFTGATTGGFTGVTAGGTVGL